jgi:hypothetical protein
VEQEDLETQSLTYLSKAKGRLGKLGGKHIKKLESSKTEKAIFLIF